MKMSLKSQISYIMVQILEQKERIGVIDWCKTQTATKERGVSCSKWVRGQIEDFYSFWYFCVFRRLFSSPSSTASSVSFLFRETEAGGGLGTKKDDDDGGGGVAGVMFVAMEAVAEMEGSRSVVSIC